MMIEGTFSDLDSYDQDDTPTAAQASLVSPAGGAESLFLAGLSTSNISAEALASKLRRNNVAPRYVRERSKSFGSVRSALSDDFQDCAETADDLLAMETAEIDDNGTAFFSVFRKPTQAPINEEDETNMPATVITSKPAPAPVPTTTAPVVEEKGADVAESVYSKAKDIWAWGKGVPVVSFGLGITEAVVGKAASVVGTDLADIDSKIKPQLASLDSGVLNPAISTVVGAVLTAAGKTEEIVKPVVITILSPFGLIKNEPENPTVN